MGKSIDPDDLKEWLEVMSCEGDSELLGELLQDGTKGWEECSDSDYESDDTVPKIDFVRSMTAPKIDHNTVLQERIAEYQKKLELTMFKSQLPPPQQQQQKNPVQRYHNDFFTGRRSALTSELEKSRNYLKMLGLNKKVQSSRTRLVDCGWQAQQQKSNSALMA